MNADDLDPSAFDGCLRLHQTSRRRDVAPGRVPVQMLMENGDVWREWEITESMLERAALLATEAGFTIEQMLAKALLVVLEEQGGAY